MTQQNGNHMLKAQRESHCFCPGKKVAERGRGEGFTLIELVTVLAVISVITVIALTGLKGGLFSEYAASQTMRKVVIGVQEARMRAFQNEQVTRVRPNGVSVVTGDTYKVEFLMDSSGSHGFRYGDYAAFTGLTFPAGMNGGAYLVTYPPEGTVTTYIQLSYVGEASSTVTTETPLAKNITGASELTIRPRTGELWDHAQRGELLYDPRRVVIWRDDGTWTPTPGMLPGDIPISGPGTMPAPFTLRFTSRGFTMDPQGYRILVARRKSDGDLSYTSGTSELTSVLWVTVSPFGMVKTGRTDYAKP